MEVPPQNFNRICHLDPLPVGIEWRVSALLPKMAAIVNTGATIFMVKKELKLQEIFDGIVNV